MSCALAVACRAQIVRLCRITGGNSQPERPLMQALIFVVALLMCVWQAPMGAVGISHHTPATGQRGSPTTLPVVGSTMGTVTPSGLLVGVRSLQQSVQAPAAGQEEAAQAPTAAGGDGGIFFCAPHACPRFYDM